MNHRAASGIDNLNKLKLEKIRLASYCAYQEKLIGLKADYFRENYAKVLGESLLPYDKKQNVNVSDLLDSVNGVIKNLIPGVFKGRYLPAMILKFMQIMMIRAFTDNHKKR